MSTARVMENGDLRLPEDVAEKLHCKPGDSLSVELQDDGTLRLHPKTLAIDDVYGMLRPAPKQHISIEAMDEGVAEAMRREWR